MPMFETLAAFVLVEHITGSFYDPPTTAPVYGRVVSPSRRPYATADGHLAVLVYTDKQWRAFFDLIGHPDWSKDARFATFNSRSQNIDECYGHVAETLATRTTAEWLEGFERAGIPAAPVNSTEDVLQDPHLAATGFFLEQETRHGRMRFPGMPAWFSATPGRVDGPAPAHGEHGRAVLEEAGFTPEEIAALVAEGGLILPE